MTLEEKYTEMMERFKKDALAAVNESISTIHCEIAPHLDTDTDANVSHQAREIVKGFLSGNFQRVDEQTACASSHSCISVFITMTTAEYDNIRKNLVDAMPACPKDLEIQSLKDQLKRAWELH
jgi:hypothetical protein